jgi:hypothetical protein
VSTKAILFILAYSVQTMRYAHPNFDSKRHATVRLEGFGESSVSPGTISRSECHTLRLWRTHSSVSLLLRLLAGRRFLSRSLVYSS